MHLRAFFAAASSLVALGIAACLGEDPDRVPNDPDAAASIDGAADGPTTAASDGGDETVYDPSCPVPPEYLPCGSQAIAYGAPALHVDACTLGRREGLRDSWPGVAGKPTLEGAPGARYCRGAFGGRPAMVFDENAFVLKKESAGALDSTGNGFAIVAVMDYVPSSRPENAAGGIVFQRNAQAYPFYGPQLTANFARQAEADMNLSLESTQLLGGSIRFGLAPDSDAGEKRGYSVVSSAARPGRMVAVVRFLASGELSLRINGVSQGTYQIGGETSLPALGTGHQVNVGAGVSDDGQASTNNYFLGRLAELLYYTDGEVDVDTLATALMTKWGIE